MSIVSLLEHRRSLLIITAEDIRTSKRRRLPVSSEDTSGVSSSSTSDSDSTDSSDSASSSSSGDSDSADSRLIHAHKVLVHSNTKDSGSNDIPSLRASHVASRVRTSVIPFSIEMPDIYWKQFQHTAVYSPTGFRKAVNAFTEPAQEAKAQIHSFSSSVSNWGWRALLYRE
jgi:hypothetical protein